VSITFTNRSTYITASKNTFYTSTFYTGSRKQNWLTGNWELDAANPNPGGNIP
jgi:hypothetical protein